MFLIITNKEGSMNVLRFVITIILVCSMSIGGPVVVSPPPIPAVQEPNRIAPILSPAIDPGPLTDEELV
jgi:hypothetical protein